MMSDDQTKQLDSSIPFPDSKAKHHLSYGQLSDVGRMRRHNEDGLYSMLATPSVEIPDFGIFIVADGMGGQVGGERASALTCKLVMRSIASQVLLPLLDPNADRPIMVDALREAFQTANAAVMQEVPGVVLPRRQPPLWATSLTSRM